MGGVVSLSSFEGSWILAWVLSYLLGSISFSFLFTRLIKKVDIRDYGSGNAGATNTRRVLGTKIAVVVFLLDALKGTTAVGLGYLLTSSPVVIVSSGLAAIIGHNWPIFLRFRGGKGIATTIGATIPLVFFPALISGILAILFIVTTRFVSLGSLIYTSSLPLTIWLVSYFRETPFIYVWMTLVMAGLAVFQHRENIKNLIKGTERKI